MIEKLLEKLFKSQKPTEEEIITLCSLVKEIFLKEPNVITVPAPVTVCGDIHGQLHDLLELLKIGGSPPYTNYLFMGDYVDRGFYSVETVSLLFCFKVLYPDRIWLLRGNHESRQITQIYGFYDECTRKYGSTAIWELFTNTFDCLPISAIINNEVFCCHGGLSPSLSSIDQLNNIDRKIEVPHEGLMCDVLWSDPEEKPGWGLSPRGAGFTFGKDITENFLQTNNLKMICRAHQLVDNGFSWSHENKCVTVFSAPNYCNRCGNLASFMEMDDGGKYRFTKFEPSPAGIDDFMVSKIPDYFL